MGVVMCFANRGVLMTRGISGAVVVGLMCLHRAGDGVKGGWSDDEIYIIPTQRRCCPSSSPSP